MNIQGRNNILQEIGKGFYILEKGKLEVIRGDKVLNVNQS